jgi:hypothetical protein
MMFLPSVRGFSIIHENAAGCKREFPDGEKRRGGIGKENRKFTSFPLHLQKKYRIMKRKLLNGKR